MVGNCASHQRLGTLRSNVGPPVGGSLRVRRQNVSDIPQTPDPEPDPDPADTPDDMPDEDDDSEDDDTA